MPDLPKNIGSIADLIKRFEEARKLWELWRSLHQEAFDFSAPQRETFHAKSPGQRKNRHIFDSTAVLGLEQFANRIQGSVLPSWMEWMSLTPGSEIPDDKAKYIEENLEKTTETFFSNLNHSNFSTEITPGLSDLGIGTGAIMIEEGSFERDETFKFTNVPLAELYPENPYGGRIKTVWREHEIAVSKIKESWQEAELSDNLASMLENNPAAKVKLINGMVYSFEDQLYHHVVIYEPEKKLLFAQSFDTQRLIVFRWHVTPGEVFGRGPIMQVLPDIRTVNKVKQFILENAALQMAGVYTGLDDGIFNPHTVRIAPGSVIPVGQNGTQNPSLQALPRSGDIGLGGLIMEDLQNNIKKALFVEPLGDITDPVRSATEVMLRNQEMLKNSGASLGRLKSELIEPLVAAGIDILRGRGLVADVKVDGKMISIKQTSPLAKAEDQEDFQNSQIWFQSIMQLAQATGPEVILGSVKVEELPGYWAEKLDVSTDVVRSEQEREQIGQALMQAAQAQAQGGQGEGQQPV